ncbi:Transmembrane protein [Pseudocercospora fuligena]|uniref:Transmembrane protein n=1 Tax=Pseudocercospora fuligena TaxID=685502 RepID=A0A8H6RK88_9PEZI|nr:Transmembrane protein [Pseudocercospora fuligena]
MVSCNTTLEDAHIKEEPVIGNTLTFHHLGLILCALFGLISVFVSLWLIFQHAIHYQRPNQQKQIIRILFMIPVYAVVSFLSFLFYRKAIYFEVLRDCYEAFAISSFFALLCDYIAPNLHEQKEYFRSVQPVNWFWSVFGLQKCTGGQNKGPLRKPRSGLTWFNVIWAGIFQYCVIRVLFTIVSVITEAFGRYCEASLSPAFGHIWVLVFESLSVTVAMFMVIQFYIQLKTDLAEHKPFLKVLSIKLVIFFSFWQTIVISFLSSDKGPLQPTKHLAYQDIKIGIPSVLLCIEMAFFSVLHIFAYPWKPYNVKHLDPMAADIADRSGYKGGSMGIKAIMDAFNPWDIIKAIARGGRWMFVGFKTRQQDVSYQPAKTGGHDETAYMGPTYAGTGEVATELQDPRRARADTYDDDRAGLLRNSQVVGTTPYRNDEYASGDDSHMFGAPPPQPPRPVADAKPFDNEDTGYHPGMAPGQAQNWNHWAGAQQQDGDLGSVGRPPTYRTHDPYS